MSKILLNSLLASPAILAAIVAVSGSAIAAEAAATKEVANTATDTQVLAVTPAAPKANVAPVQIASTPVEAPASVNAADTSLTQINRYVREGRSGNSQDAVTSVSQLTDVKPTDWAFQALESLVQRYGCIAGYPDRKFRGNQAMTRYEFAAGLNSCLDQVNALIAAGTADLAKKEDLETLRKLQQDFAAELATLRGRVDALEARTATLEKQQFSTTTKLAGEVVFNVTDELGQPTNNNTVFQDRVRLALNTSFSGKDLLVTRLAAGNAVAFNSLSAARALGASPETTQAVQAGAAGGNAVSADWVAYFGSLGDKLKFYIPAIGGLHYDYAPTSSPSLDVGDGGGGPISYFGQRNPIYAIGGGSGLGVNYQLSKDIAVSVGYLANNTVNGNGTNAANNPAVNNGLFTGSYSALAQLAYTGDKFGAGLTYVNAYVNSGGIFNAGVGGGLTGTGVANGGGLLGPGAASAAVNAFGGEAYFKLSPKIVINGFFSYIDASFKALPGGSATGEIWTYGLGLSFPDLGKKGNLGGIIVGAQPYLGNAVQIAGAANNTTPVHVEGFYKYQLSDNISITPGLIWIINPGQNSANQDVIIGTIRTTFTF